MIICSGCGNRLSDGSKFCGNCGKRLVTNTKVCKRCGNTINLNANFCGKCGLAVIPLANDGANHTEKTSSIFIQAICSNCGAHLVVDKLKGSAYCTSCGTPYVINNSAYSKPEKGQNKVYDFVIEKGQLLEYKGQAKDVNIPEFITVIGEGAFSGANITSVSIPDSVKTINKFAFHYYNQQAHIAYAVPTDKLLFLYFDFLHGNSIMLVTNKLMRCNHGFCY